MTTIERWFPGCSVTVHDETEEGQCGIVERGTERIASFLIAPNGLSMVGVIGQFCGTADEHAAFAERYGKRVLP